jgi:DNA-binding MarR family transcriptional regulator
VTDADEPRDATPSDPAETIAEALGRLRGRRGPGRGGMGMGPGGPAPHGHRAHDDAHHRGPFGRGMPPWAGADRGGGPALWRLIEAVAAASGPLSVSEIGEAIGVDQPRASRLVQQGVDHGMLRREADPDDARRTRIALTEQGVTFARGFRGQRRAAVDQALEALTPQERAELARLLAKFADGWPQ